jgi:hypothetical protein
MADPVRYGIGDLADLASVSRRTVRYYVQEGLLPAPFGVGRGNHYGREHLDQLLRVKALQEPGPHSVRSAARSKTAFRVTGSSGRRCSGPWNARCGVASALRRESSCTSQEASACRRRER